MTYRYLTLYSHDIRKMFNNHIDKEVDEFVSKISRDRENETEV